MNLRNQRRIAADLLKVGVNKVRFDSDRLEDVHEALTRDDLRYLISSGAITKKQDKGNSRGRIRKRLNQKKKGKRRGQGKRKGSSKARNGGKRAWVNKIRALRDELRTLKTNGVITQGQYRSFYLKAKGNLFHSRRHMREYIERTVK